MENLAADQTLDLPEILLSLGHGDHHTVTLRNRSVTTCASACKTGC
jgi:hypothetical protein